MVPLAIALVVALAVQDRGITDVDRDGRRRPGAAGARGPGAADEPHLRRRRRAAGAPGDARPAPQRRREPGQRRHGAASTRPGRSPTTASASRRVEPAPGHDEEEVRGLLGALAASAGARNATTQAIAEGIPAEAAARRRRGAVLVGAQVERRAARRRRDAGARRARHPRPRRRARARRAARARSSATRASGAGWCCWPRSPQPLDGEALPGGLEPVGIALLVEGLREEAVGAVSFLAAQGVDLKVISGDGVETVQAVAVAAGVPGAEPASPARTSRATTRPWPTRRSRRRCSGGSPPRRSSA